MPEQKPVSETKASASKETTTRTSSLQEAMSEGEEGEPLEGELETPTSNDVGKQTQTKADLGYDVTKEEGEPPEKFASPRHPDDPSGKPDEEHDA